ncbi:MAG: alternative ribosome rescue aminoacyl-tRNA hydrolase ArfB [Planctomycetota bacterium]
MPAPSNAPATDQPDPPNTIRLAPNVFLPEAELRFEFVRSSGPGGQNVNKRSTKAVLTVSRDALAAVLPPGAFRRLIAGSARYLTDTHLILTDSGSRSQRANRDACTTRLAELVAVALVRPTPRKKTKPSRAAHQRRLDAKKQRGQLKQSRRTPGN